MQLRHDLLPFLTHQLELVFNERSVLCGTQLLVAFSTTIDGRLTLRH